MALRNLLQTTPGTGIDTYLRRQAEEYGKPGSLGVSPAEASGYGVNQTIDPQANPYINYSPIDWSKASVPQVAGASDIRNPYAGGGSEMANQGGFKFGGNRQVATAPVASPTDYAVSQAQAVKDAQSQFAKDNASIVKDYEKNYADVFASLDAQLANLPSEREQQMGFVEANTGISRRVAEGARDQALRNLAASEQGVIQTGKTNLRNLAEDTRNTLQSAGRYIGALGAGDSSAAGVATGLLGRQSMKQRGLLLDAQKAEMDKISQQKADVDTVFQNAVAGIEQQKNQQLAELTRYFSTTMRDLENAKANSSFQKGQQITQAQQNLRTDLTNRLRTLSDELRQKQSNLEDWRMKRQAEMEDYAQKLSMAGTYTGANKFTKEAETLSKVAATLQSLNPRLTPNEAYQAAQQQTGIYIDLPAGTGTGISLDEENKRLQNLKLQQDINLLGGVSTPTTGATGSSLIF